jgi:O-antigen ligase
MFISTLFSKYQETMISMEIIQSLELGVLATLLYVLLANYWDDEYWASLAKLMVLMAAISSVTIVTDFLEITRFSESLGAKIYQTPGYIRVAGILGEANYGAGKLGIMLPFCFFLYTYYRSRGEKPKAFISLIVFVPIIIGIFLTGSRMGMLEALLTLTYGLFYLVFRRTRGIERRSIVFVAILASVAILVVVITLLPIGNIPSITSSKYEKTFTRYHNIWTYLTKSNVTGETALPLRIDLLRFGMEKFVEKPIAGYGLGGFVKLSSEEFGRGFVAHNTFIGMLVDTGLIGGLSFIGLFAYAFYNILKSKERLGVFYHAFIISAINLLVMLFFLSSYADKLLWGMFIPISMYLEQMRKEKVSQGRISDPSVVQY